MITKTGLHAVRAMMVLGELPDGAFSGATAIAEEIGAPPNYLGKLLQQLSREGLVFSQKGFGGGFRLARKPSEITLFDVIEPIEKVSRWEECFLGHKLCSDETACVVHFPYKKVRDTYLNFLRETQIADLTEQRTSAPADTSQ